MATTSKTTYRLTWETVKPMERWRYMVGDTQTTPNGSIPEQDWVKAQSTGEDLASITQQGQILKNSDDFVRNVALCKTIVTTTETDIAL